MEAESTLDEVRLRSLLVQAESAARLAAEALLEGLAPIDARVRASFEVLRDYCSRCPDAFQALDIARLLRALVHDLESGVYAIGSITEWAHAEIRLQALASRIARVLRDQRDFVVEQALVDLAVLHLRALEESPMYAKILGEMSRLADTALAAQPLAPLDEFLGMARRRFTLPIRPPAVT